MRNQEEIERKFHQINKIRDIEKDITADLFKRGQLAGAQQALAWILELGMEPIRTFLSDEELALLPSWPRGKWRIGRRQGT